MERTNELAKAAVALITGPGSVALSFEERIALGLRILGLLLGCTVSGVMVWSIVLGRLDKRREAKLRMAHEQVALQREAAQLCYHCQQGQPPRECPLPPEKCPLKHPPGPII